MRGKNSNTYFFANQIIKGLSRICNDKIESEVLCANDVKINQCQGCSKCFATGKCVFDCKDDMEYIRSKILEADLIIVGSPVYFQNISGQTKILFDRLAYWSHVFRLIGKPVITVSTSGSNGNKIINSYLNKALCSLGASVIGSFGCTCEYPPLLRDEIYINNEIHKISTMVKNTLESDSPLKTTEFQEELFKNLKFQFSTFSKENKFEHSYWSENDYYNCTSFQELIELKKA